MSPKSLKLHAAEGKEICDEGLCSHNGLVRLLNSTTIATTSDLGAPYEIPFIIPGSHFEQAKSKQDASFCRDEVK